MLHDAGEPREAPQMQPPLSAREVSGAGVWLGSSRGAASISMNVETRIILCNVRSANKRG